MSSVEDDKDSVFSLYGSRESLAPATARKAKRPALKLAINQRPPSNNTLPPVSPRQERKQFETQPPRTPIKETASQIYHKSFSDLNRGLDFIFQSKSRPPSRASNFGDVATKEMQHKKETDPGVNGPSNVQSHDNNAKDKQSKTLVKSLSRKNLYEEVAEKMDDLDVYHTISGGRIRNITTTRTTKPFSKIQRTANKTLPSSNSFPEKIIDDEYDNESIFSLGEDLWRVRTQSCISHIGDFTLH